MAVIQDWTLCNPGGEHHQGHAAIDEKVARIAPGGASPGVILDTIWNLLSNI